MPFDQPTRNRLARFVADARALLTEEFTRQLQNDFGLDPASGDAADLSKLTGLDEPRRQTARLLRDMLAHYLAASPAATPTAKTRQEALDRIVREQAFTVLNRLCALRMAEARGPLIESVGQGYSSKGFQLYARLAGPALGETGDAYAAYLLSVFDELAVDLPALFDRFSPHGRLFPREATLLQVLAKINHPDIAALWAEDETIGWIYQYFNSKEERKAMRDASQAPRNSRELAVRNQFFTPRYVVEFLTDNTLGRIWYEMTQGETGLKESCRYLVRRPNEIFLKGGEAAPNAEAEAHDAQEPAPLPGGAERPRSEAEGKRPGEGENAAGSDLSQQDLLNQPVYIPHRPLKDPREIKMLDPACGSMHFGLYAFDLFERIYEEAWDREQSLATSHRPLTTDFPDRAAFLREVPRLIIEHNIHGIDIDPRAVQIAGLSLWLRAQKRWHDLGVKAAQRPRIRRSNIVCAEPMPGEAALLDEFINDELEADAEGRVLGAVVRRAFEAMKLAGEAGSLLKIEEEIAGALAQAEAAWKALRERPRQGALLREVEAPYQTSLDLADARSIGAGFWEAAEARIYAALQAYAERAEAEGDADGSAQRRLFADDTARGFAFIDLCRGRYDVVLMNPPFGETTAVSKSNVFETYTQSKYDLAACFADRARSLMPKLGLGGSLTNRSNFFGQMLEGWRRETFIVNGSLSVFGDLGVGVLDGALVEAVAYAFTAHPCNEPTLFIRTTDRTQELERYIDELREGNLPCNSYFVNVHMFEPIPDLPFSYWAPASWLSTYRRFKTVESLGFVVKQGMESSDNFRFVRLWWESPHDEPKWKPYSKGGWFGPQWRDLDVVVNWGTNGHEVKAFSSSIFGTSTKQITNTDYYGVPGLCYPMSRVEFSPRILPSGTVVGCKGPIVTLRIQERGSNTTHIALLAIMSCSSFRALVNLTTPSGDTMRKSYRERAVASTPIPSPSQIDQEAISEVCSIIEFLRTFQQTIETNRSFLRLLDTKARSFLAKEIRERRERLDELLATHFGFQGPPYVAFGQTGYDDLQEDIQLVSDEIVAYSVGCAVGRWDTRYATGEKPAPELPDPFAPLPACPPGMLQNAQGLPATPADVPANYLLRITWGGILPDDEGHPDDIVARTREALRVIWGERADAIEQEAYDILGVQSLRDYFRKPALFFAEHLKRYSKSRRQAPIYWPLSTPSGSYTLWLYYHRLSDQTLYTCVNDFVEPKLKLVGDQWSVLSKKAGRSAKDEKELEQLTDLEAELKDFRAELLRLAPLWKPNLNDGVQITAAPLWRLFGHRPWQKKMRETWESLEAGDYDWAHLAYSLWPERVREKCRADKSLAIAHDLESLYVEPPATAKKKGGRKKAKAAPTEALALLDDDD